MRVHTRTVWDMATGQMLEDECYEYAGPVERCDRAAQGSAAAAGKTAGDTAAELGAEASGIGSNLTPFLTQQLLHPQGFSQQDMTQMLNQSEAGSGGSTSSITGAAADMAARTRNPSGFTSALDEVARDRDKAAAGSSEDIAAKNAGLKQEQQQSAAKNLAGEQGLDTDAMLKSMGIETGDINAQTEAGKSGWLQNSLDIIKTLTGGANAAAGLKTAFSGGGG